MTKEKIAKAQSASEKTIGGTLPLLLSEPRIMFIIQPNHHITNKNPIAMGTKVNIELFS
ncbi:hypothetical protein SPIRO4BDMA_50453 [uncultured spirochete]|uniref:Uncharacterized protein n=1 Tax=uncultured spirochete TaxID=156406 RepID=A0A3P3XRJ2_9SPIR|nr:hypothetical protein SPIRO4BDMA_50453 [uncultured spirochete]